MLAAFKRRPRLHVVRDDGAAVRPRWFVRHVVITVVVAFATYAAVSWLVVRR